MAKSVVVTGGNSGIGLQTVLELASAGYDVVGTVRSRAKAREMREAAAARQVSVRAVLLDVADAESVARGFDRIATLTDGGPWAVVNNAGFAQAGAVEDVSDDEVVSGIQLLASTEGVFAETAGGVTVATLRRLLADGRLDPDEETVVLNTGDGLKTLDAVVPVARPTATIAPTLEAFREAGLA